MPSLRPIRNSGWGVRPPYSRPTATTSSPSVAIPHFVRPNSRSSRSQIAYAANSRSCSRNARRTARSVVERATSEPRWPTAIVAISPPPRGPAAGRRPVPRRRARHPRVGALDRRRRSPPRTGAAASPRSVTIAAHESRRRHVLDGVASRRAHGRDARSRRREDRPGRALLELHGGPVGRRRIHGDGRHADHERHAGRRRRQRQRVGPGGRDHVAVGGDPVGPHEHDVDVARRDPPGRRGIGDHRVGHAGLAQLPGRDPRALETRPRLRDEHRDLALGVVRRDDRRQRRPELAAAHRARCCRTSARAACRRRSPASPSSAASAWPTSAPCASEASATIASASACSSRRRSSRRRPRCPAAPRRRASG